MRILLISYLFPPFNSMGAVRVGKLAKFLTVFGHDVRVLTAEDQLPYQPTLPPEIPTENIIYTKWFNPNKSLDKISYSLRHFYASNFALPDQQMGWYPFAIRAGSKLIGEWKPDLIYASGLPPTSLVIAHSLSLKFEIPWIAELRDLWMDNPYHKYPQWRRKLDQHLERRVLSTASGFVATTEKQANILSIKFKKPAVTVFNGFDPEDFPSQERKISRSDKIQLVHTGELYDGRRDPSPIFEALNLLGKASEKVQIVFYGERMDIARRLAHQYSVERSVEFRASVPYRESLKVQSEADVLLLLIWDDPKEQMICPGKLFEYIGARRPILVRGFPDSVAAELVRDNGLGVVLNEPPKIAEQMEVWIEQKQRSGYIPSLSGEQAEKFTRGQQIKILENFIFDLLPAVAHETARR